MDKFEKIKESVDIADVVEHFGVLLNSIDKAICPFHNEKTPSFSINRKENYFKCFGCGASGDAIDFVSKFKGVEPIEAVRILAEAFNINIDDDILKEKKMDIKKYIQSCINDVSKTDYFNNRGLTDESIKRFHLGFDVSHNSVVIPYSSKLKYYQSRSIVDKKFFKPKTDDAGPEPLYNKEALCNKDNQPVFVVESPICAMSIIQEGGIAVALCQQSSF